MIEFILILVIILVIILFFSYIMQSENILIIEKEKAILRTEKMLKIAEKKFLKGKIKKDMFEDIQDDLSAEKINLEFELRTIKRAEEIDVSAKTETLNERSNNPSRHRKLSIKKLLEKTELLRHEMGAVEKRFLKHEIKESVFRKVIKEKEAQLIRIESKIIELVNEE